MQQEKMKAICVHETGGPEVLQYEDVDRPLPGKGEVLIRVHAAGINPAELHVRDGFRVLPEAKRPPVGLPYFPGSDVSGVVAAVGEAVTAFKVNDAVFGMINFPPVNGKGGRTYAEYCTAPVADLALKPSILSHTAAAAVPMAALTAWQLLCLDPGFIQPGQTVVVNGAAGGVGHFAVQFAKLKKANVIAIASGRHEAFLQEIGADRFIDYTKTGITANDIADAAIYFNCVGGAASAQLYKSLRPGSTVIVLMPQPMIPVSLVDELHKLDIAIKGSLVHSSGQQLTAISDWMMLQEIKVKIDSVFTLAEVAQAHTYAEKGHLQGKVVLEVP